MDAKPPSGGESGGGGGILSSLGVVLLLSPADLLRCDRSKGFRVRGGEEGDFLDDALWF